eukprot:4692073-Amphidinium_carterae.1
MQRLKGNAPQNRPINQEETTQRNLWSVDTALGLGRNVVTVSDTCIGVDLEHWMKRSLAAVCLLLLAKAGRRHLHGGGYGALDEAFASSCVSGGILAGGGLAVDISHGVQFAMWVAMVVCMHVSGKMAAGGALFNFLDKNHDGVSSYGNTTPIDRK